MINNITFANYRIFANKQSLELAPMTVIFGKNNTGKSAVLRLPLLVESALKCKSQEVFSRICNDVTLCDEFRDIVYNKANRALEIGVTSTKGDELLFSFYVDVTDKQKKTHLEKWSLKDANGNSVSYQIDDHQKMVDDNGREIIFTGIIPNPISEEWIEEALRHFQIQNDYIGHIRSLPMRDYRLSDNVHTLMGTKGENAYEYLISDVINGNGTLLDKVSNWYKKVFDGWSVIIDQSRAPSYSVELQNKNVRNNVLDTGAGIGQSLPEIVAVAKSCEIPWQYILEEPETHLHPAAHAEMAEFMAHEVLLDNNKQILVETHSLNFILRLRTLVATNNLKSNDLALYYVKYDEGTGSSSLKKVKVGEDGSVSDWPDDVFNESYKEAVLLHNAQKNR